MHDRLRTIKFDLGRWVQGHPLAAGLVVFGLMTPLCPACTNINIEVPKVLQDPNRPADDMGTQPTSEPNYNNPGESTP